MCKADVTGNDVRPTSGCFTRPEEVRDVSPAARHDSDSRPQSGRRFKSALILLAVTSLLASACGSDRPSPTVAGAGSTTAQPSSSNVSAPPNPSSSGSTVAFAHCMRAHGVTNFPDQDTGGKFPTAQDLGVSSAVFQTASNACEQLLPSDNPSSQASPELLNKVLQFARCMRSHGFPSWPDPTPTPSGPRPYTFKLGAVHGFDPRSPQVDTALNTCQRITGLGETGPPPFGLQRPPP